MKVKCIDNSKYPTFFVVGKIYTVVGNFTLNNERHYWIEDFEGYEEIGQPCGVEKRFFESVRKIKYPETTN